jgi:2-polyprenyl-3-methyl-5-hydroxy-6-metoxy-1,4-benzoquinol methylase
MKPEAMTPYGLALLDYYRGNKWAALTVIRDDGLIETMTAEPFFRPAQEFEIERIALELVHGRVLDVGAGTGLHSIFLQEKGLTVCAIDILPQAIQIMHERGVIDAHQTDILSLGGEKFDTIIMMGHGIGTVENISGLDRFLSHTAESLNSGGQILLTSLDVRISGESKNLEYQKRNIESGRYFGEIRMQFKYGDMTGPMFGWLQIDAQTLKEQAQAFGWLCEVIQVQNDGNYLARLSM